MKRWGNTPAIAAGISTKARIPTCQLRTLQTYCRAGTAAKNVEPTYHRDRQADYAHERFFLSRECCVLENGLDDAVPSNEQGADCHVGGLH
jgi:hypothetical protein